MYLRWLVKLVLAVEHVESINQQYAREWKLLAMPKYIWNSQTFTVYNSFTYELSVPIFSVFRMKAEFYGESPFILGNFLGYWEICNSKKKIIWKLFLHSALKRFWSIENYSNYSYVDRIQKGRQQKENFIHETIIQKNRTERNSQFSEKNSLGSLKLKLEKNVHF